ncbi:YueH family protein [Bacillus sp. B190/17]|uniref:YueH family protein n=1 Tax=Bacillus lumedeiriae TaxID=3058829 RepID=A0ABW8I827_9BACI
MKIRKTYLNEEEVKVFIYENKKEETVVVAVPSAEWSISFTYEEAGEALIERLADSLAGTNLDAQSASEMSQRIYQWTHEM